MNIPKSSIGPKNISFSGHSKKLDKTGYEVQQFYYMYDPDKYDCDVELYNIIRDRKGNMQVLNPQNPQKVLKMNGGFSVKADMMDIPEIDSNIGFGYRFKLTDKATKETSYAFDNGTVLGIFDDKKENKYNVVLNNRAVINKNGPMQLIMPDEYYPGIENYHGQPRLNEGLRAKALASVRTHANKLGGNFYGIISRLPELEKEGVKRIVGTPYTKDTISSHKYWTENAYQISPEFGNENDFKKLQIELFKHDMNWIADAALVNEGLSGIHISELLRKGQDSFSKNMFRADERPQLGILPDKCEFTRMKIINAPFKILSDGTFEEKNANYNPSKPTYIQFYDSRLASEEQKKSDSPIDLTTYANKNTQNMYDITKHDDAVYPVPIEVNPSELTRNAKRVVQKHTQVDLSDIDIMKELSDFTNFTVQNKSYAGGLEVWDGNVDIPKLNFYRSAKDDERFSKLLPDDRKHAIEAFDRGALAVRDYAINSGKYWTKLTSDTLLQYISKTIGGVASSYNDYASEINKEVSKGNLPKEVLNVVDKEVLMNVVDDNYHLRTLDDADMRSSLNPKGYGNEYSVSDYILKKAMDCPLETLPFSANLLGVLTSPYIAKKANTDEELGVSRFDLSEAGNPNLPKEYKNVYEQMDSVYKDDITPLIENILDGVKGISVKSELKDLDRYIISEITPDLTKYIFIKAINPNADIKVSADGEFDFSGVDESEYTIQSLGIPYSGKSLEEESQIVVNILEQGILKLASNPDEISTLRNAAIKRFEKRTLKDFKVAEMIIDRLEAGQGWRIDASKDIASIDAVRSNSDSMTKAWNNVIDFWKKYNESVLEINPHAYTTAEITDLYDLFKNEAKTVFTSDADAERKFLEATGITAVANYNYFFSLLPDLYSQYNFESGGESWRAVQGKNFELRDKLDAGWSGTNPGFLFQSPDDGVVNSYTFVGNHDKPRVLHCLALDMGLFNCAFDKKPEEIKSNLKILENLKDKNDLTEEEKAQKAAAEKELKHYMDAAVCLGKKIENITDKDSPKAVAMGTRLRSAFYDVLQNSDLTKEVNRAIKQLANGTFKGKKFDADAFGTRPFEIAIRSVLDQVEDNGIKVPNREELEAKVLENILEPAFDRFYSIYKLLTVLPGSPTDFAGDRVGTTGFETKAKNYHQQNRNVIHWEWLNDDNYKFIRTFYNNINNISNLRNMEELSALNDGATVTLPIAVPDKKDDGSVELRNSEKLQAFLRYNDKGSVVLVLNDLSGADTDYKSKMKRGETKTSTENNLYNRIVLSSETAGIKQGLKHGLKKDVTVFKNARMGDDSVYKVATMTKDGKEYYYIKRVDSTGKELPITIKPEDLNTLILYKV